MEGEAKRGGGQEEAVFVEGKGRREESQLSEHGVREVDEGRGRSSQSSTSEGRSSGRGKRRAR